MTCPLCYHEDHYIEKTYYPGVKTLFYCGPPCRYAELKEMTRALVPTGAIPHIHSTIVNEERIHALLLGYYI